MATKLIEFHGYAPLSDASVSLAARKWCPFVDQRCKKSQSGGACSLQAPSSPPVIICPNRLYSNKFEIIRRIARATFGVNFELVTDRIAELRRRSGSLTSNEVVVYGQGFSGEIGIKAPSEEGESGSFKVDFLLTQVDDKLSPTSIVAIEVQTIDTTSSYRPVASSLYNGHPFVSDRGENVSDAGLNWENVTKRILPQIIYKGHALRREKLASYGLYFVLPDPVLSKILTRVGGSLLEYPRGPGTVTFQSYQLAPIWSGPERYLIPVREFTTSVEQIAYAFVSPQNLPPLGIYESNLAVKLHALSRVRNL